MKRFAIGSALLLVFLVGSPAVWACGYLCTEVYEGCSQCVFQPDDPNPGCVQVSACSCRDALCSPSAAQEKATTPEAFGIFAPTPDGVPMSVAKPALLPRGRR